jgi:polyferredoxin
MVLHGLLGPRLAPRNLATLLTWIHYRGVLVLVLVAAGNLFCMGCPFMLPRNLARRYLRPALNWPRWLRNKWLAIALFVAILFAYERYDLWGAPRWTAALILTYFAGALLVDGLFRNASFCKYVCPLGQYNFTASTISPLELAVANHDVCATCTTHDCIRGTRDPAGTVVQRGCELSLFQPLKVGNMDCTFCLDCVHACPHDNVALTTRLPASELWIDPRRSGIGRFSRRTDLAVLALLFAIGGLFNAFAMVHPAHAMQTWLGAAFRLQTETATLGLLVALLLVVVPALVLCGAAWATRLLAAPGASVAGEITRFAYSLIPVGLGVWLAHYAFHMLTGLWTVIPVTQQALRDAGASWVGEPRWSLTGLPEEYVTPLEVGFLALGWMATLVVAYRIAQRDHPAHAGKAFVPWAVVATLILAAAAWTMSQPMAMRGSMMGM